MKKELSPFDESSFVCSEQRHTALELHFLDVGQAGGIVEILGRCCVVNHPDAAVGTIQKTAMACVVNVVFRLIVMHGNNALLPVTKSLLTGVRL